MVKSVVDPTILPNAGLARPLTVTAPEGTILNCKHPAAVNGRVQTCQRVADLILGALAQAVPARVSACTNSSCCVATFSGEMPKDGTIWVYLETMGGGAGARPTKDGLDGVHVHVTNTSNLPVEALELEYPLTLLRYELVDGSGGAGKFRGGMGLRRVYRAEADCRVRVDVSRLRSQSWGLLGGLAGAHGRMVRGAGRHVQSRRCRAEGRRLARGDHARRRRLRPAGRTRPRSGCARSRRRRHRYRRSRVTSMVSTHEELAMTLTVSRRSVLAGAAALPFLRIPGARAATPGTLTFGLSSYPPNILPWANTGTAAATIKLMIYRGLTGFAPDGSLRGELAESWAAEGSTAGSSSCATRSSRTAKRSPAPT